MLRQACIKGSQGEDLTPPECADVVKERLLAYMESRITAYLDFQSNESDVTIDTSLQFARYKFDAFAGLCGMIEVIDGRRSEGVPEDEAIRTWEGWILGQEA